MKNDGVCSSEKPSSGEIQKIHGLTDLIPEFNDEVSQLEYGECREFEIPFSTKL